MHARNTIKRNRKYKMKIASVKLNSLNAKFPKQIGFKSNNNYQDSKPNNLYPASNCNANINIANINFKSQKPDTNFEAYVNKIYSLKHTHKQNAQDAVVVAKSVLHKLKKIKEEGHEIAWYEPLETQDGTWNFSDPLIDNAYLNYSFTDNNNKWSIAIEYNQKTNYIYNVDIFKKDAATGKTTKTMETDCTILKAAEQNEINTNMLEKALDEADRSYKNIDNKKITKEGIKLNRALRNRYGYEKQKARQNGCFNEEFTDSNNKKWYFDLGLNCSYKTQRKEWNIRASVDYENRPAEIMITSKNLNTGEIETYAINLFEYEDLYSKQAEPFSQTDFDKSDGVSQAVVDKQKELEGQVIKTECKYLDEHIKKLESLEDYMDKLQYMIDNIEEYESDCDYYEADRDYLASKKSEAYKEFKKHENILETKRFQHRPLTIFQQVRMMNEELDKARSRYYQEEYEKERELRKLIL